MMNLPTMKKKTKNLLAKTICLTLLVSLLTMTVGRVQRVQAVGLATVGAAAASAALTVGAAYMAYVLLTDGEFSLTGVDSLTDYLTGLGTRAQHYIPSQALYDTAYAYALDSDNDIMDYVVDLDIDTLTSMYNSLKDVDLNQSIGSYQYSIDVSQTAFNGFSYPYTMVVPSDTVESTPVGSLQFSWYYTGTPICLVSSSNTAYFCPTNLITGTYRNILQSNLYRVQQLVNGTWEYVNDIEYGLGKTNGQSTLGNRYIYPLYSLREYTYSYNAGHVTIVSGATYPLLPHEAIYDAANDSYLPMVEVSPDRYQLDPNWNYPNDQKYPLVPYVKLPSGGGGNIPSKWGFKIGDLIDALGDIGEGLVTGSLIQQLINALASDPSYTLNYSPYNEGDTYYFTVYNNTVNDYDYPTYNINISDQDDVMPVDLNTLTNYTDNQYLDSVLDHAQSFGSTIGEYVAFWFNSDNELVIVLLGCSIFTLICAFIGKWGHS